jgi:hypothetical protein
MSENKELVKPKGKKGGPQPGSGRPPLPIDGEMVYKLAQTMLTEKSIATILGCSVDVIQNRFSHILQQGRDNRRHTLTQAMWSKALDEKDTKMQIWLSKQHLGYKDTMPIEATQINFNVYVNEVPK